MKYNEKKVIWDLSKPIFLLPKEVKKIYSKSYRSNFKEFNYWIDKISRDNSLNINWWFSRPASRDERLSNLFRHICILKSIRDLDRLNLKIKIITTSTKFQKLINSYKLKNIELSSKNKNFISAIYIFFKEILILKINILLSKIFLNKQKIQKKNINLINYFEFQKKGSIKRLFGNSLKKYNYKYYFVPSFINFNIKNLIKFKNKKNFIIKENFLNFFDIFLVLKNLLLKKIILKRNFQKYNLNELIKEEFDIDQNFRSILMAYVNYIFFGKLKLHNIKIENIISWHENQLVDKGWSLGIKKNYSGTKFFGYQASTLHPHFFNLCITPEEVKAGSAPKNIILIGKKYKKNRSIFFKKINFNFTNDHRFKFEKSKLKKNYILFLLSGIKEIDDMLIFIFKHTKNLGYKNLKIKFHPILKSKEMSESFKEEIDGNGSNIINFSKIVITTSYTSGLYESLARNCNTIMINTNPLDYMLFKDLKKYSKNIFYLDELNQVNLLITKCLSQKIDTKDNKKIKNYFFHK